MLHLLFSLPTFWKGHATPASCRSAFLILYLALTVGFCYTHFSETSSSKVTNCFHKVTKPMAFFCFDSILAFDILHNSLLRAVVSMTFPTLCVSFTFTAKNAVILACTSGRELQIWVWIWKTWSLTAEEGNCKQQNRSCMQRFLV